MSTVSIVRLKGENVMGAVRTAVELVGGFRDLIREKYVLIKPNVFKAANSGTGLITDFRVTEAITKMVLEGSPRRVVIGEGCAWGYLYPTPQDTIKPFMMSGTMEVAKKLGVELIDLNRDEKVEVEVPNALVMKKFRVAKTALDVDVRISVPVLKTHSQATITCSLKNMKGVLPGLEKSLTHKFGLERALVDLNRVVKPHFALVDAINGMQGMWNPEDSLYMGLILSGYDPVAVDSVCARLMGFDSSRIQYLRLAQEGGLGIADPSKIKVLGERLEDVARNFLPFMEAFRSRYPSVELIEKCACTGCIGEIRNMFGFLDISGLTPNIGDLKLIVGTPDAIPEKGKKVIIGRCAEKFKEAGIYVTGCPPHGREISLAVSKAFDLDKKRLLKIIENRNSRAH